MTRRAALGLAALCLGACTGGAGHPVRQSLPRLGPAEVRAAAPGALPEPGPPTAEIAAAFLFRGLEGVLRPLERLHALPVADPRAPSVVGLPRMEAAVLARHRGGGHGGPVRVVVALGATGFVPLRPVAAADLWMDAEVERQALEASTFSVLGTEYAHEGTRRLRYLIGLRRVGRGPVRFDLRFACGVERWDLADGRVLLRYDPRPQVPPEHVTLYRGGCLIEPAEHGARVTEILILGTDIVLPLLEGALKEVTRDRLRKRVVRLWAAAWAGR